MYSGTVRRTQTFLISRFGIVQRRGRVVCDCIQSHKPGPMPGAWRMISAEYRIGQDTNNIGIVKGLPTKQLEIARELAGCANLSNPQRRSDRERYRPA